MNDIFADTESRAEPCIAGRLRKVLRVVCGHYDRLLRPTNLRLTQFGLLCVIADEGPLSAKTLSDRMRLEKSSLSRELTHLRTAGWVTEKPGSDRRERLLQITDAGIQKINDTLPYWKMAQAEIVALLGNSGLAAVDTLVGSLL